MSRKADAQKAARVREDRHDAHVRRFMAGHRNQSTERGRQWAESDRARARELDARAARNEKG